MSIYTWCEPMGSHQVYRVPFRHSTAGRRARSDTLWFSRIKHFDVRVGEELGR